MTRSRRSSVIFGALVAAALVQCSATVASAGIGPLAVTRDGGSHRLAPAFAGFNSPFRLNSWQALSPRLHEAVAGLRPGAIRVFGGTTANYWDWRSGTFFDRPGVPPRLRRVGREMTPIHLSDWAQLVHDADATPVFDLNLVTSNLDDQLEMLDAAQALGMPIRRIELGNELYYSAPLVVQAMPTAESYGRKATRWIEAIRSRFPDAQVAASGFGYPRRPGDDRQTGWNRGLRRTLRGETALAFHDYWPAPPGRRLSGPNLSEALAAPVLALRKLRARAFGHLPDGVRAWVTEWNFSHQAALRGTWANGLAAAEYLLGLVSEPAVTQEDLHPMVHGKPLAALFGNRQGFGEGSPTVRFAPTAVGEAIGELYPAIHGGAAVRRLAVSGAPPLSGTRIPGIRAVEVEGRGVVSVNLTGRRLRLALPAALGCEGSLQSVWARPSARITGEPGVVRRASASAQGELTLPARSVSRFSC